MKVRQVVVVVLVKLDELASRERLAAAVAPGGLGLRGAGRECARLGGVHSDLAFSVGRVPGRSSTRGAISFCVYILLQIFTNVHNYGKIFPVNFEPWR
jgi:hypothetical protein